MSDVVVIDTANMPDELSARIWAEMIGAEQRLLAQLREVMADEREFRESIAQPDRDRIFAQAMVILRDQGVLPPELLDPPEIKDGVKA